MVDMSEFKKGDIVLVVKPYNSIPWSNKKGKIGTITSVEPKTATWESIVNVSFDDGILSFFLSQIELAKNHIVTSILNDL